MKILFITHYTKLYGANRSLLALLDGIEDHIEPHVLVPSNGAMVDEIIKRDIQYHIRPFKIAFTPSKRNAWNWLQRIAYMPRLMKLVFLLKPDLIYTNTSVIDYGAWLSMFFCRPHVWHIREYGDKDYGVYYDGGKRLFRYLLRKAASIIAISKSIQTEVIAPLNSNLIYNGVIKVPGDKHKTRVLEGTPRFAIIGLLQASKGQEAAIKAFSGFIQKTGAGKLLIIGSGEETYEKKLMQQVHELGLEREIEFTGFQHELIEFYENTDIMLMCSDFEAFGRVTVEAMHQGIPVIGKSSGGTKEIIEHGKDGLLYETEEQLLNYMIELSTNQKLYESLSINGMLKANKTFTVAQYSRQLNQVLEKVGSA